MCLCVCVCCGCICVVGVCTSGNEHIKIEFNSVVITAAPSGADCLANTVASHNKQV